MAAVEPPGSLIYDASVRAEIAAPDEFDGFTIDLDDHQRITLVVDPDASLQPLVRLMDLSGAPIDGATVSFRLLEATGSRPLAWLGTVETP